MDINRKRIKVEILKRRLYFGVSEQECTRAAIQFSIMLIASSIMGAIFAKYFISGIFVARNASIAVRYFNNILPYHQETFKIILAVINNSKLELMSVIAIMLSAFRRFNYLLCDIVLVVRGFLDSFLCVFLLRCLRNEFLNPNISVLDFTVCFLSKVFLILLLYIFSQRLFACSLSIKNADISGESKIKIRSTLYAFFLTLREMLTIIFLKSISFAIIFLTK